MIVVFTMTTGTLFLFGLVNKITEKGIGNGISLIIALGIVSQIPSAIGLLVKQLNLGSQTSGQMSLTSILILSIVFVAVIMGTVLIIQGQKKYLFNTQDVSLVRMNLMTLQRTYLLKLTMQALSQLYSLLPY